MKKFLDLSNLVQGKIRHPEIVFDVNCQGMTHVESVAIDNSIINIMFSRFTVARVVTSLLHPYLTNHLFGSIELKITLHDRLHVAEDNACPT